MTQVKKKGLSRKTTDLGHCKEQHIQAKNLAQTYVKKTDRGRDTTDPDEEQQG